MIKYLKTLIYPFYQPIRHPFKTIQRNLAIEEEWANVKIALGPHRGKILIFIGITTFPLYVDLLRFMNRSMISTVQGEFKQGQPIETFINNFVKSEVQVVLKDQQIQQESVDFVQRLAKSGKVQESIVDLLKQSVQNPVFVDESKIFGKKLVLDLLDDKQIQDCTQKLVIQIVNDPLVKFEVKEMFKGLAQNDEIREAFIDILKQAANDQSFRAAFSNSFAYAFNDVILRKETTEKIRMFILFLIESENNQDQSVKGFIDLLINKLMNKKTRISKVNEFDLLLESLYGKEQVQTINSEHKFNEEPKQGVL